MGLQSFSEYCLLRLDEEVARLDSALAEALAAAEGLVETVLMFEAEVEAEPRATGHVTHRMTKSFYQQLKDLPDSVRATAQERFAVLQANPRDPSLHFGFWGSHTKDVWQVYVNFRYRALAVKSRNSRGPVFIWFWIGPRETLNHHQRFHNPDVGVPDIEKDMGSPQYPANP